MLTESPAQYTKLPQRLNLPANQLRRKKCWAFENLLYTAAHAATNDVLVEIKSIADAERNDSDTDKLDVLEWYLMAEMQAKALLMMFGK